MRLLDDLEKESLVVASEIVLVRGYFDEGNKSRERRVVLKSDFRRRCASPFDFVIQSDR